MRYGGTNENDVSRVRFLWGSLFLCVTDSRYRKNRIGCIAVSRKYEHSFFILRLFFFSQCIAICQFRLCITPSLIQRPWESG